MSGNSGGGYYGGGGSGTHSNCDNVSVKGTVNSPVPAVLARVQVGDDLDISLRTATGPLQAVLTDGSVLGSVFTASSNSIIECINNGSEFNGRITSLNGGHCELLITSK